MVNGPVAAGSMLARMPASAPKEGSDAGLSDSSVLAPEERTFRGPSGQTPTFAESLQARRLRQIEDASPEESASADSASSPQHLPFAWAQPVPGRSSHEAPKDERQSSGVCQDVTTALPSLASGVFAPAARPLPLNAPALPMAQPEPPSATLLALARQPGALPRQWQLELSTQPHAAPVVLHAERHTAEPGRPSAAGWALQVQLPGTSAGAASAPLGAMAAVQQERLAARLARGGITISTLHVQTGHPPAHARGFDERLDDDAHDDRR